MDVTCVDGLYRRHFVTCLLRCYVKRCYRCGWSVQRTFCYMLVEVLCEVMLQVWMVCTEDILLHAC